MTFGYTIIYVPSVPEALEFYERAFGFNSKFLHESQDYGELETGATTLAFASHGLGEANFGDGYNKVNESDKPFGIEIAFVTEGVTEAYHRALRAGAATISAPIQKPWGQVVAYVRAPEGTLIELCSPIA